MMSILLLVMIGGVIFLGTAALMLAPSLVKPSPEAQHMVDVVGGRRKAEVAAVPRTTISQRVVTLTAGLRGRLGFGENLKAKKRLVSAGYRGPQAGNLLFAAQCILPIAGGFAGSLMKESTFFWMFAGALVGYMMPDFWLTRRISTRQAKLRKSMPDAIDLLVICVDAGLGLDQAMIRVTDELVVSHPEIYQEFQQVILEQRAGQPRLEAWNNMVARTGVDEFAAFANMLTQTDRFGTPILKALVRFSEDLRARRRQRAEEAAEKTKIKIIFPLVLCIFPSLFIVLLAPALLSILSGLKGLAK